jgi:hypothetical protein
MTVCDMIAIFDLGLKVLCVCSLELQKAKENRIKDRSFLLTRRSQ